MNYDKLITRGLVLAEERAKANRTSSFKAAWDGVMLNSTYGTLSSSIASQNMQSGSTSFTMKIRKSV